MGAMVVLATTKKVQVVAGLINLGLIFILGLFLLSVLFTNDYSRHREIQTSQYSGVSASLPPERQGPSEKNVYSKWGQLLPIRDDDQKTRFLVAFKSAWYGRHSDERAEQLFCDKNKRTFYIVYSYQNLGPREGYFSFKNPFESNIELLTDKGHIYSGDEWSEPVFHKVVFGDWAENRTKKVDDTGEIALAFDIPKDSVPTELSIKMTGKVLKVKLPQPPFETKERFAINPFNDIRTKD